MRQITRRDFISGVAATAAAAGLMRGVSAADRRKPNVILIFSDDHGWADVGCQGCRDVPTPNIDSIAASGVRFTDGYVSCPVCSPSRAGLITGRYQTRFGHEGNPSRQTETTIRWGLPTSEKTLADYLKEAGYTTGVVGKWHLGDEAEYHPNRRGFDEFFGFIGGAHPYNDPTVKSFNTIQRNGKPVNEREYLTDAFGREAASFVRRHKARPFFLYLAFNAVHQPLDTPPKLKDAFPEIKEPKRQAFARVLKSMDDNIGRVLEAVRREGLEQDTIIIFLGDNGGPTPGNTSRNNPFRGYKTHVHEGGIRVPFMMQWKGRIKPGQVFRQPVISLDLLPTIIAAAGCVVPRKVDGVGLAPWLDGSTSGPVHSALYWKFDKQLAVRQGDWKLSRHKDKGVRLYNLSKDPGEKDDLSAKEPERVEQLQALWDAWDKGNKPAMWPCKQDAPWVDELW